MRTRILDNWIGLSATLSLVMAISTSAEPPKPKELKGRVGAGTSPDDYADVLFNIENEADVRSFHELRGKLECSAVATLSLRARGRPVQSEMVGRAAYVAARLRLDNPAAIEGMCTNVLHRGFTRKLNPFHGFVRAKQLAEIGPRASWGIAAYLKRPVSRDELLVLGYALACMDQPQDAVTQMEAALKAQDVPPSELQRQNVNQVTAYALNPRFGHAKRDWPKAGDPTPSPDHGDPLTAEEREATACMGDAEAFAKLPRLIEKVERDAAAALFYWERGEKEVSNEVAYAAAELLGSIRTSEQHILDVLARNVSLQRAGKENDDDPLSSFPAAQALVQSGGRQAFSAVRQSLNKPLDRQQLLIRAHILRQIANTETLQAWLHNALAPIGEEERACYHDNLDQVRRLVQLDNLSTDRSNWPLRAASSGNR